MKTGGGGCSYVLHALAVRSLTTHPREDGALFPQDRPPMTSRSFLLCQRWIKNVSCTVGIYPIDITSRPFNSLPLPQYSYRLLSPNPRFNYLTAVSSFFSQLSHVHFPLLLQRTFRNYRKPVFGAALIYLPSS
ncbi:unnamed protein product [Ectocarpus sp. 12 AP-2014]